MYLKQAGWFFSRICLWYLCLFLCIRFLLFHLSLLIFIVAEASRVKFRTLSLRDPLRAISLIFFRGCDVCHLIFLLHQMKDLHSHRSSCLELSVPRFYLPPLSVECSWVLLLFTMKSPDSIFWIFSWIEKLRPTSYRTLGRCFLEVKFQHVQKSIGHERDLSSSEK